MQRPRPLPDLRPLLSAGSRARGGWCAGLLLAGGLLGACGGGDVAPSGDPGDAGSPDGAGVRAAGPDGAGASADSGPGGSDIGPGAAALRVEDPRLTDLRDALDLADVAQAEALLPLAAPLAGPPEEDLLQARLCLLRSDLQGAEQALSRARAAAPDDPRVPATAAEVHAWGGLMDTAERDIQNALRRWQTGTPELVRARGVHLICTEGGARAGLALLQEARAADPDLPFCRRALGQAHMLVGKSHGVTNPTLALEHARASIEFDPVDPDGRLFLADALMTSGEWGQGLEVYEVLLAEGRPLEPEVARHYKNAGVVALAQGLRELAVDYFVRARELGIEPEEFKSGQNVLNDEVRLRLEEAEALRAAGDAAGAEALVVECERLDPDSEHLRRHRSRVEIDTAVRLAAEGDPLEAEAHLAAALRHDPDSLEAHRYLGQLRFQREDWDGAAESWYVVVDTARLEGIDLPEPVHHRLAEALFQAGREADAREALEAYLVLEPNGAWVAQTRRLLELLPEPAEPEEPLEDDGDEPVDEAFEGPAPDAGEGSSDDSGDGATEGAGGR